MATIIIPTPLRRFTNNTARLNINGASVSEAIRELTHNFPELKKHLLEENGRIRSFVNVFVGENDIRDLQQEETSVSESDVISIVPAIAGGAPGFSPEELARYNRHIIIPQFGLEGQQKLK